MDPLLIIPIVIITALLFGFIGWILNTKSGKNSKVIAEERAKQVIADAQKDVSNLKREKLLEVKDEWYKKKTEFDGEVNQKRQKISALEKQLITREENIEKKFDVVIKKEKDNKQFEKEITDLKKVLDSKIIEIQIIESDQNLKLEKISGLTSEEAKKMLMENMVNKAKTEVSHIIKELHDKVKTDAKKEAQKVIVQAIQRTAADHSIETTVSVVQIINDDMKGRIIRSEEHTSELQSL